MLTLVTYTDTSIDGRFSTWKFSVLFFLEAKLGCVVTSSILGGKLFSAEAAPHNRPQDPLNNRVNRYSW